MSSLLSSVSSSPYAGPAGGGVGGASLPGTPPPRSWSPVAGHGLGGGGGDGASVATLPPSHAGSRTVSVWGVAVIAFFLTGAGPYGAEVGAWERGGVGRAGEMIASISV